MKLLNYLGNENVLKDPFAEYGTPEMVFSIERLINKIYSSSDAIRMEVMKMYLLPSPYPYNPLFIR